MHKRESILVKMVNQILKSESETAETLNSYLPNIVKNLNISRYSEFDSATENIQKQSFLEVSKRCS